jgi:peptide-methionine (S)-S-oxide reductase
MFGAGCFWGVEEVFRAMQGVIDTKVGYAGGTTTNPTYADVCTDTTGHAEVVRVTYDPSRVRYTELLETFWNTHNPTSVNRQGPDIGTQYRSVIFYVDDTQKSEAEKSRDALVASGKWKQPIVTEIVPAAPFYAAEAYHQRYLAKRGMSTCHV